MISPLLIGNITTVGAFASLIPLDAPALHDLGLFAAFMLVGTIIFVLVFLPHLVKSRVSAGEERLTFGKISSKSPERHQWLLWVIFLLTLVFGWYSLDTSFDTNMHHINYMTDEQTELLSSMRASAGLNDSINVYLVTEGDTWDDALNERQQIAPLLDSLQTAGVLNTYSDVTTLICSQQEQQRRINRWNAFWESHRSEALALLARKAPDHGFSREAFDGFEAIISNSYSPQAFEHFEPLRSVLLNGSFSESTGRCSVVDVIDMRDKDSAPMEALLNERLDGVGYAFDFSGMNSAIANSLSNDFNYIGFACGFIVFLFLWISFGRLELSLLAFLPMALGWIWILGIMSMLDMQFNIVNVILATFIFGQGDDYTIFITDGLLNEFAYRKKLLPSYKNSIVISALIMFIGMGSLIVAKHPALHSLAEVTIVGMFTVVLMAWVVPPLIFNWLVRRHGEVRPEPITIPFLLRKLIGCRNPHQPGTTHYYHNYLIGKYTYKGFGIERETRQLLKHYDDFSEWIDGYTPESQSGRVTVVNAGRGQFPLLFALVHPEVEVYSYANDPDDVALAAACEPMPANLHIGSADQQEVTDGPVIDFEDILNRIIVKQ